MKASLSWSKGLFSNSYYISSNNERIGTLKNNKFSRSGEGLFKGKAYIFNTKGILKQHTEIIDTADNKVVADCRSDNYFFCNREVSASIINTFKLVKLHYDATFHI